MPTPRQPLPVLTVPPAQLECRRCGVVCQKVVHPSRCLEMACPFLYAHRQFGRTYLGCTQKVFAAEIDSEVLERSRRRRLGFGGVRAIRQPLAGCPVEIERCYEGREDPLGCVNPEFHEPPQGDPFRVTITRPIADEPAG